MRLRQIAVACAAVMALTGILATDAMAQRRGKDWVLLGEQRVGFKVDRDAITINHPEDWFRTRRFRGLQFVAEGNDIHLMSIRLVYMNGFSENWPVDRLIRQGQSLPLDLRGERSFLQRIEMVYRARPDFRGQATIRVFGEPARGGPPPMPPGPPPRPGPGPGAANWEELGCQQVALVGKDRDTIRVGRREGRFRSIRLLVRGADVEILDLKVIYGNGQPDDLAVRQRIRAGERTRPLDLQGRERTIDRIDLTYRTRLNPVDIIAKGRLRSADVCVEGLQ
jgi:hypothetical protein